MLELPPMISLPGRWVEAGHVQIGDQLLLMNGKEVSVEEVETVPYAEKVFNLEIAEVHTYAVGKTGVLVHNSNCIDEIENGMGGVAPNKGADAFEEGLSTWRGVDIGIKRPARHHIFPQEMREFFEKRDFRDIDKYTIPLDEATHQAIHKWMGSGPWNDIMKSRIISEEASLGRMLSKREILEIGARMRREAGLSHIKIVPFQD
jgi:hypothetical protein